jgi:hypothetical protein
MLISRQVLDNVTFVRQVLQRLISKKPRNHLRGLLINGAQTRNLYIQLTS